MLQIQLMDRSKSGRSRNRLAFSRTDTSTRFRLREERLQLVVNELRHRTKNLLAVVQVIARQTCQRSIDLAAFQSQFFQRLSGLSRSLDLLVQQGGRGAGVAELVRSQLEPFGQVDATRITATGPDVQLSPVDAERLDTSGSQMALAARALGPIGTFRV